jgi:ABC-type sugar transport system ATPase subunit
MNFLDLRVVSVSGREMRLERPGLSDGVTVQISEQPPAPGTVVTVGLRPEHVQTGDGPGLAVEATSTMVEAMGNVLYEYFEGPEDLRLTVERRDLRAAGVGTTARLILPTQRLHLFAPSGERINTG